MSFMQKEKEKQVHQISIKTLSNHICQYRIKTIYYSKRQIQVDQFLTDFCSPWLIDTSKLINLMTSSLKRIMVWISFYITQSCWNHHTNERIISFLSLGKNIRDLIDLFGIVFLNFFDLGKSNIYSNLWVRGRPCGV